MEKLLQKLKDSGLDCYINKAGTHLNFKDKNKIFIEPVFNRKNVRFEINSEPDIMFMFYDLCVYRHLDRFDKIVFELSLMDKDNFKIGAIFFKQKGKIK